MPQSIKNLRKTVRPWRLFLVVLVSVFVLEAAVMFVLPLLLPARSGYIVEAMIDALLLTIMLAPVLWLLVIRPLQVLVDVRTQLLQRVLTAQEDERGRIARDLHDGLGQSLTSLLVGLRAVEEISTEPQVRQQLDELRRIGGETHEEIRRLARGLRPAVLDDVGLAAAIDRLCADVEQASGGRVRVWFEYDESHRLPPAVETACFRIVQEALANAIRHGNCSEIEVQLDVTSDEVGLSVRDNGSGSPAAPRPSPADTQDPFRLWTIRERVALLGGSVQIELPTSGGTRVTCRIPVDLTEPHDGEDPSAHRG